MDKKCVLAIGIDPACVDLSPYPGQTPELIRAHVEVQLERVRNAGYDVHMCLLDPERTPQETAEGALQAKDFDCVMIGAGLRNAPAHLLLFEEVINLVHAVAPRARICFNTSPGDTLDAVQRWV